MAQTELYLTYELRTQLQNLLKGGQTNQQMADWAEELVALINHLHTEGRDAKHGEVTKRIVTSKKYDAHCLRRQPPTQITPLATGDPTLRIPFVWFDDKETDTEIAVLFFIGDKTAVGNDWYPETVKRLTEELVPNWEATHPSHKARLARRG